MTVYVEAYAFINIAMDLFLLALCALFSGKRLRPAGTAAGCLFGGIYSVAAYGLFSGLLANAAAKMACTLLMVAMAFGKMPAFTYLKVFFAFFIASFVAGGTGFGLMYLLGMGGFGPGAMLLLACAATASVYTLLGVRKARRFSVWRLAVIVEGENTSAALNAFIDSGNSLTEPISALPVAICFDPGLEKILAPSNRYASFDTIGGGGELRLYTPRAIYSISNGRKERLHDIYIAFSGRKNDRKDIDLLLPPSAVL